MIRLLKGVKRRITPSLKLFIGQIPVNLNEVKNELKKLHTSNDCDELRWQKRKWPNKYALQHTY